MASIALYAGASRSLGQGDKLPSPSDIKKSYEQIWDENAGRNGKGNMVATFIAEKMTYDIKWGILNASQFASVKDKLPHGFFYFREGNVGDGSANGKKYYRGEIQADVLYAGGSHYYKDVSVQVIQK